MRRSQRGLFHGKGMGRKTQTCFSEKKSIVRQKPNARKQSFFSEILKRQVNLHVSTTALRHIRHRGSLDNYVLLTHPKELDSIYGEYLRRLMLLKLNDPEYKVPYIVKSRP